jgi:hypothetical protein
MLKLFYTENFMMFWDSGHELRRFKPDFVFPILYFLYLYIWVEFPLRAVVREIYTKNRIFKTSLLT